MGPVHCSVTLSAMRGGEEVGCIVYEGGEEVGCIVVTCMVTFKCNGSHRLDYK